PTRRAGPDDMLSDEPQKVCMAAEALPLGDPREACPLAAKSEPLLLMRTLVVDHKLVTPSRPLSCIWSAAIMDVAARNSHIDIVRLLHEQRTERRSTWEIDDAAMHGRLAVVRYLRHHRTDGCTVAALDGAAWFGHLAAVDLLRHAIAMDSASAGGHLDVVGFLHERRTEDCTLAATDMAAAAGLIDAMACLRSHCTEGRTAKAMDSAAMFGRIVVLQWLHHVRRSQRPSPHALTNAAFHGHVDTIRRLVDTFPGIEWHFDAAVKAARQLACPAAADFLDPRVRA
ncbi:hypothetical protein HK105_209489, partial [Polyrhizophydium stewartii]